MNRADTDRAAALAASKASQAKAKRENAKHTHGPWAYHNTPTPFIHVNAGGLPICQIYTSTAHGQSMGEQFANARLIAAAPEMLAALDGLAAQVRPLLTELDIDGFQHSALKDAYDFACKVAGKAQGEPQ